MTLPVRPVLARRARMRWDATRDHHVLLVPEGVVTLTPEAAEVLGLCDGVRDLPAVLDALRVRYPEVPMETLHGDVTDLLARLVARGYVVDAP